MTRTNCDLCNLFKETITISQTFKGNEVFPLEPMIMTMSLCAQCVGTNQIKMAVTA